MDIETFRRRNVIIALAEILASVTVRSGNNSLTVNLLYINIVYKKQIIWLQHVPPQVTCFYLLLMYIS